VCSQLYVLLITARRDRYGGSLQAAVIWSRSRRRLDIGLRLVSAGRVSRAVSCYKDCQTLSEVKLCEVSTQFTVPTTIRPMQPLRNDRTAVGLTGDDAIGSLPHQRLSGCLKHHMARLQKL